VKRNRKHINAIEMAHLMLKTSAGLRTSLVPKISVLTQAKRFDTRIANQSGGFDTPYSERQVQKRYTPHPKSPHHLTVIHRPPQTKLNRPVSDSVMIYAFPAVAISSITNRVTGVVLSVGASSPPLARSPEAQEGPRS